MVIPGREGALPRGRALAPLGARRPARCAALVARWDVSGAAVTDGADGAGPAGRSPTAGGGASVITVPDGPALMTGNRAHSHIVIVMVN